MRWLFCIVVLSGVVPVAQSAEDPSLWKIGLAQAAITPDEPLYLAGYSSRNKPYERVETDLYVKAMAFASYTGQRAVLVTSDLIGFRTEIAEPICQRICEKTGLQRGQILLNSSHIHSGPILSLDESRAGTGLPTTRGGP